MEIKSDLSNGSFESKMEIIDINDDFHLLFVYVPKNYKFSSHKLEGHKTKYLGKLNSFNRIKLLENWKFQQGCLVKFFTEVLKNRNWDFEKYPNPSASVFYRETSFIQD